MANDFEVIVNDPERKKDFEEVFGTNIVKVISPIPKWIISPDGKECLAYFLDLNLISKEQEEKLIRFISKKFGQTETFVRDNLKSYGVPILAEHCTCFIANPQRWL